MNILEISQTGLPSLSIVIKTDSLKCLDQCHNNKNILAKERILVLLARISLKYHQVIWLESGAEILKQALSTFYIFNIENSIQE